MDHLGSWNTVLMLETNEQLAIVNREAGGTFDASPSTLASPGKAAVAAAKKLRKNKGYAKIMKNGGIGAPVGYWVKLALVGVKEVNAKRR
ncbi:hypothetical protein FF1_022306 [Malus domestica]